MSFGLGVPNVKALRRLYEVLHSAMVNGGYWIVGLCDYVVGL